MEELIKIIKLENAMLRGELIHTRALMVALFNVMGVKDDEIAELDKQITKMTNDEFKKEVGGIGNEI